MRTRYRKFVTAAMLILVMAIGATACAGGTGAPAASEPAASGAGQSPEPAPEPPADRDPDPNGGAETDPAADEPQPAQVDLGIAVGDKLGNFTVTDVSSADGRGPVGPDNFRIELDGSATVNVGFDHLQDGYDGETVVWLDNPDEAAAAVLPQFPQIGDSPYRLPMTVSNHEAIAGQFPPAVSTGRTTVVVKNIVMQRLAGADLPPITVEVAEVIDVENVDLAVLDFHTVAVGDTFGDFTVSAVTSVSGRGPADPDRNIRVDFSGTATITVEFDHSSFFGDDYVWIKRPHRGTIAAMPLYPRLEFVPWQPPLSALNYSEIALQLPPPGTSGYMTIEIEGLVMQFLAQSDTPPMMIDVVKVKEVFH